MLLAVHHVLRGNTSSSIVGCASSALSALCEKKHDPRQLRGPG